MKIVFKKEFVFKLSKQVDYIATDSVLRARKFNSDLLAKILTISNFPYSSRKSIYFDDDNIRDLIFKGYTIVYRITEEQIEVFGLVKFQKKP